MINLYTIPILPALSCNAESHFKAILYYSGICIGYYKYISNQNEFIVI